MSMNHQVAITCPQCGQNSPFTVWDSLNIKENPELKERLLSLDLFTFRCPHCSQTANVMYSFLYHDMDNHFMIYHIAQGDPDDMANDAFHEAENDSLMKHKEYKLRIVHSLDELSEKIMLFEGGFDDRIMELAKAAAMAQAQSQYPDFPITSSHLVQDGSDVQLILLDKDKQQQAHIPFTDGVDVLYAQFSTAFSDILQEASEGVWTIDYVWAQSFIKKYVLN